MMHYLVLLAGVGVQPGTLTAISAVVTLRDWIYHHRHGRRAADVNRVWWDAQGPTRLVLVLIQREDVLSGHNVPFEGRLSHALSAVESAAKSGQHFVPIRSEHHI